MSGVVEYTRQREWFDPAEVTLSRATIVGAGGIGSFAALALAKLGVQELTLLDFDTVEAHNLPNQMYPVSSLGESKVAALADVVSLFSEAEPITVDGYLGDGVPLNPIVISALDSMAARDDLWSQVKYQMGCSLFLDARLGGQHIVLYAVNPIDPVDVDGYEATLHSDAEGMELSCTARSIIDVGFAVGALITRAVRRHFTRQEVERVIYQNQETLAIHKGGWTL